MILYNQNYQIRRKIFFICFFSANSTLRLTVGHVEHRGVPGRSSGVHQLPAARVRAGLPTRAAAARAERPARQG